jgi:hypothetical protein
MQSILFWLATLFEFYIGMVVISSSVTVIADAFGGLGVEHSIPQKMLRLLISIVLGAIGIAIVSVCLAGYVKK